MFPFVSFRANGGAVLDPEGPGADAAAVPGAAFFVSSSDCQFRYRRKAPANTTTSARISCTAPIPLRDNVPLFIPRPPGLHLAGFDAHDSKSDVLLLRCDRERPLLRCGIAAGVHYFPP